MPYDISLEATRAKVSMPLSQLAQDIVQPDFVMRYAYPLVPVPTYGGVIPRVDDSIYEEVDDNRADDTPYPEIQEGIDGAAFRLTTKGLSYRVPDKRKREYQNLGINWGRRAIRALMKRGGLMHEIEAANRATTAANYAATNRITLAAGSRFGNIDPDPVIRTGLSAIALSSGTDANVGIMGRLVFDALATKFAQNFTSTGTSPGLRNQLTLDVLANIYGLRKMLICNAIVKRNNVKQRVFGNHLVLASVPEEAIATGQLNYRANANLDFEIDPSFGYTLVIDGNPQVFDPYYDNDRSATVYKMDFDRALTNTGVDDSNLITHGYLIENAA